MVQPPGRFCLEEVKRLREFTVVVCIGSRSVSSSSFPGTRIRRTSMRICRTPPEHRCERAEPTKSTRFVLFCCARFGFTVLSGRARGRANICINIAARPSCRNEKHIAICQIHLAERRCAREQPTANQLRNGSSPHLGARTKLSTHAVEIAAQPWSLAQGAM